MLWVAHGAYCLCLESSPEMDPEPGSGNRRQGKLRTTADSRYRNGRSGMNHGKYDTARNVYKSGKKDEEV